MADLNIKTWQERYNAMGTGPSFSDKSVAMLAEIDDLRAALEAARSAVPAQAGAAEARTPSIDSNEFEALMFAYRDAAHVSGQYRAVVAHVNAWRLKALMAQAVRIRTALKPQAQGEHSAGVGEVLRFITQERDSPMSMEQYAKRVKELLGGADTSAGVGDFREFVEAIAHNFESMSEDGEKMCRGCSGLIEWDVEDGSHFESHRKDCIVLRARAFLAATAQGDGEHSGRVAALGPVEVIERRLTCNGCSALETHDWRDYTEGETDRGTSAKCSEAGGKSITAYWSEKDAPPSWCPVAAAHKAQQEQP